MANRTVSWWSGLKRVVPALVCGWASLGSGAAFAFEPVEFLVSPNRGLIDFEFSQSRGMVAHTDPMGRLWIADVDRATGAFLPWHGRGTLIATDTVSKANMFKWNGPEWIGTASGDQLVFSYYRGGAPKIAYNTRMAAAVRDQQGNWVTSAIQSGGQPAMMHTTSRELGDPNAQIKYLDPQLNHWWRNLADPESATWLDFLPPSNKSWRFASGWRALLYAAQVEGNRRQLFAYLLDNGRRIQLTFDDGDKDIAQSVPWAWRASEFGGDFVLSTVVDYSELRIYRRVETPQGQVSWQVVRRAIVPDGRTIGSPEWFEYRGKSYLSMAVFRAGDNFPSEVWISNIDGASPLLRKVTVDEPFRVRNDPEVFITAAGPFVYYNRYDPSVNPDSPLCRDCSEGVYAADTGLGAD